MINKIYQGLKRAIIADPIELYEKERDLLDKPFHFPGTNGKAVLLIHGWTSVPYELRRLGQYLNESGYTAYAPMLSGHGTVPKNLEGVGWTDWVADVEAAYEEIKKNHSAVVVVGTSMGANLAALLANNKKEIAGLVLLAMPYRIRLERSVIFFAKFLRLFKKYSRKRYPPTFGAAATITRLVSYQTYPVSSALEVPKLVADCRKILPSIKQPCLAIQSTSDHVVARKSLDKIYDTLGAPVKKKLYIKRAYHTFIADIKNENVFEEIHKFMEDIKSP